MYDRLSPRYKQALSSLAFAIVLLPFLRPFDIGPASDVQAWAAVVSGLLSAVVITGAKNMRMPVPLWLLAGIAFYALLDMSIRGDAEFGFRSVFGYASVPLLAYTAFKTYRLVWRFTLPALVGVWLFVGLVQLVWDRHFAAGILPRLSTDSVRGITGLAPEPSALGYSALFMLVLNEFFFNEKRYGARIYYCVIAALLLLMLASSSGLGILLVALFIAVRALVMVSAHPKRALAIVDVIIIGVVAYGLYTGLQRPNPFARADSGLPATVTPTPTATRSPVPTSTPTVSPDPTGTPPADTTPKPTATPTRAVTATPSSATNTLVPATPEVTPEPTPTSLSVTATPTHAATATPAATPSPTVKPTATPTPSVVPTPTIVPTPTMVPTTTIPPKLSGQRGRNLLVRFFDDPMKTFQQDGSVGERTSHILLSGISLYESKGIGYGPGTWNAHARDLVATSPDWVQRMTLRKFDLGGRVMSGWGSALFEIGIVGVLFGATIVYVMARSVLMDRRLMTASLMSALLVIAVMVGAVPLALPVFGYIVGIHMRVAYPETSDA